MEHNDTRLLQAGEFAERAGVTVRMLHHYDELGLLKPSAHSESGYRLYGEAELARLQQILMLRYVGVPLKQIKEIVEAGAHSLSAVLLIQRKVRLERQRRVEDALSAIERALSAIHRDDQESWKAVQSAIEAIKMEQNWMEQDWEWVKRYSTDEQREQLAARNVPPEVIERSQRDWAQLISEVEAAKGEDPSGAHAQDLARRWRASIKQFTQKDPAWEQSLKKLWSDQEHWPKDFKRPWSDEAQAFIGQAMAHLRDT